MKKSLLIGSLTFRGGAVAVYASLDGVAVLTLDEVVVATFRPSALTRLRTAAELVEHAAHVSRAQPQLCVLLCRAWREHLRLLDEARTIETTAVVTESVFAGAPS